MAAPTNTYNSVTNLELGQIPQVDDPDLYRELLDIHNAIENLLKGSDAADADFAAYIAKQRNNTTITANYTVLATDGTILVDASGGDIIVTMRPVVDGPGFRYNIKRIDTVVANKVTIVGDGAELIDTRVGGINVSTFSAYTVKADAVGWNII